LIALGLSSASMSGPGTLVRSYAMPNVFVARQPIFNRRLEVVGYELLARGGRAAEAFVASCDYATETVILDAVTGIALEQLVGSKTAWVNVARRFVTDEPARAVPAGLVGLEILDEGPVDDELLAALRSLKRQGYELALDDFQYRPEAAPLLALVDVVKLDVVALGPDRLIEQLALVEPYRAATLAQRIDTRADHELCVAAGCDLLQGLFFCEPSRSRGSGVAADRLALLRLLAAAHDPAVELGDLERLLSSDAALAARLLGYVNSSYFWLGGEVRSIGQALALLGVEKLRPWAVLSVLASIPDKPAELAVVALIRARFCQRAGEALAIASQGELFALGLFSVIDAVMDASIQDVLASLALGSDLGEALIERRGPRGLLLDCLAALESGELERAEAIVSRAGELYVESLVWASRAATKLFDAPDLAPPGRVPDQRPQSQWS